MRSGHEGWGESGRGSQAAGQRTEQEQKQHWTGASSTVHLTAAHMRVWVLCAPAPNPLSLQPYVPLALNPSIFESSQPR